MADDIINNALPKQPKRRWVLPLIITLCVILGLVLAAIIGVSIYMDSLLDKVNYVTEHTTLSQEDAASIAQDEWETGTGDAEEDVTVPTDPVEPVVPGDHVVNILLIGQDRRGGTRNERSDSMILVTCNKSTGKITLTSIMRDQYVNIPGYGNDKLCHAYQYGGMPLLDQTLYDHFGVQIDGNVEVDFSGFESVIDLLGGVDLYLTEREAWTVSVDNGRRLSEGMNHLNGKEALSYARIRYLDNDYKRSERQRKVLLALIEKYKGQNLSTMISLVEQILPLVTTDIPKDQVLSYALELFPMLSGAQIETTRIPVDGTFKGGYIKVSPTHRMWCQYNIDFEANRRILEKILGE